MENQNILRIVLSCAILAAFFLPLNSTPIFGTNISSWNLLVDSITNLNRIQDYPIAQFVMSGCLLLILICTVIIFITSVTKKETSVYFNLLPLFTIIAMVAFSVTQSEDTVAQTLQSLGTGFYIMFLSSFLLPFTSIAVNNTANA